MTQKGPVTIELDELPELPTVPQYGPLPEATAMGRLAAQGRQRGSRLTRWLARALVALAALALGVWSWDFAVGLLSRSPFLGTAAAVLIGAVVLMVIAVVGRELAALNRLGRVDRLRQSADAARASGDLAAARQAVRAIQTLYARRGDTAWGLARLAERQDEPMEAATLLNLAEREVLAPLDARAIAEIETASARVATITALVPLALIDVAAALWTSVTMIRRIAEVYGGTSGTLGAWRLTRAVLAHMAATGAVAVGDDLIGSTLGGGMLSKVSRRFGEGLINGALTARVGVAAMELTRPLAFSAERRPAVTTIVRRALTGLFSREG